MAAIKAASETTELLLDAADDDILSLGEYSRSHVRWQGETSDKRRVRVCVCVCKYRQDGVATMRGALRAHDDVVGIMLGVVVVVVGAVREGGSG